MVLSGIVMLILVLARLAKLTKFGKLDGVLPILLLGLGFGLRVWGSGYGER